MPKLKELALAAIKNGIKSCDAVEETFSKFTSRFVCGTSPRTIHSSTIHADTQKWLTFIP